MDALAPEIEEPIGQPQILAAVLLAVDLKGQHLGSGLQAVFIDAQFDLPGGKPGVDRLGGALHHPAGHRHDTFGPHGLDRAEQGVRRIQHALGDAVVIAQIDKQEIAVITLAVDPAREAYGLAGIGKAQLSAGVRAIGVHRDHPKKARRKRHFCPSLVNPGVGREPIPVYSKSNDPNRRDRRPG